MVNHWIFVITEYSTYNVGNINDTINELKKEKKWKIGKRTVYKRNIKKDDKIIFYVSGLNQKKFLLTAELNSEFYDDSNRIYGYVDLKNIVFFKNPVPIRPIINDLQFITNKKYWGLYFSGGICKINIYDYDTIMKYAQKLNK